MYSHHSEANSRVISTHKTPSVTALCGSKLPPLRFTANPIMSNIYTCNNIAHTASVCSLRRSEAEMKLHNKTLDGRFSVFLQDSSWRRKQKHLGVKRSFTSCLLNSEWFHKEMNRPGERNCVKTNLCFWFFQDVEPSVSLLCWDDLTLTSVSSSNRSSPFGLRLWSVWVPPSVFGAGSFPLMQTTDISTAADEGQTICNSWNEVQMDKCCKLKRN